MPCRWEGVLPAPKFGIADGALSLNDTVRDWEDYYNFHGAHGTLDGKTHYSGFGTSKTSASVSPKS